MVEDVQTTYVKPETPGGFAPTGPTFMAWAARMLHLVHCHAAWSVFYTAESAAACANATSLEKEVLSVECSHEACVVVKR